MCIFPWLCGICSLWVNSRLWYSRTWLCDVAGLRVESRLVCRLGYSRIWQCGTVPAGEKPAAVQPSWWRPEVATQWALLHVVVRCSQKYLQGKAMVLCQQAEAQG